jgi:hypothetical protein
MGGEQEGKLLLLILSLLFCFIFQLQMGLLPGGSGITIRHITQITHITQNDNTLKQITAHNTLHTDRTLYIQ